MFVANSDWFIALFVMIDWGNHFGFELRTLN